MEPKVGFEPTTSALRKHCSTTELLRRVFRANKIIGKGDCQIIQHPDNKNIGGV